MLERLEAELEVEMNDTIGAIISSLRRLSLAVEP